MFIREINGSFFFFLHCLCHQYIRGGTRNWSPEIPICLIHLCVFINECTILIQRLLFIQTLYPCEKTLLLSLYTRCHRCKLAYHIWCSKFRTIYSAKMIIPNLSFFLFWKCNGRVPVPAMQTRADLVVQCKIVAAGTTAGYIQLVIIQIMCLFPLFLRKN